MPPAAMHARRAATAASQWQRYAPTKCRELVRRQSTASGAAPQTLNQIAASPTFPGARNSPSTTETSFLDPKGVPPIATFRYLTRDGKWKKENTKPDGAGIEHERVVEWYKTMLTLNVLDGIASDAQRQGKFSFYMAATGEEAIMIGAAAAIGKDDVITCQYRETGVFLQRGFNLKDVMSQLLHNKNDPGKGRNMPVHYSGRLKTGIHAVASTLGTQIPHATGAAYQLKMADQRSATKDPRVAFTFFGEGAASEGDFHGALNFAAVRDCPVVFLCRNNGFAISTPSSEQYRGDGIASRAMGYGMTAIRVDGTDIFAVYDAVTAARKKALEDGGKPVLVELMSYRVSHHSTSDDSLTYRTRQDLEPWRTNDAPLTILRAWLTDKGLWSDEQEKSTRADLKKQIVNEMKAAEKELKPRLSSVWDDVYAEYSEEQKEQRAELKRIIEKYPGEYDPQNYDGGLAAL